MIEQVISAFLGFVSPLVVPLGKSIVDYKKDKAEKNHELAIVDLKLKHQKVLQEGDFETRKVEAEARQEEAIHTVNTVGVKWVDALNASVRPVVAYFFFALFVCSRFYDKIAFTDTDYVIFITIISYFYGYRTMQKFFTGKKNG